MTASVQMTGMRSAASSGNVRAGGRQTGDGSFADMVSSSLSAQKENSGTPAKTERVSAARTETDRADAPAKADDVKRTADADETVKCQEEKSPDENPAAEMKAAKETEKETGELTQTKAEASDETVEQGVLFAESLKKLVNAAQTLESQKLNELKQAVMDTLGIDEEELEKILEQIGADVLGLMQSQILQQLVVAVEGNNDPAVLLTSESAMNDFKTLIAKAEEIMADVPSETESLLTEARTDAADFEKLFADGKMQGEEVLKESAEEASDSTKTKVRTVSDDEGEADFSFETVREGSEAAKTKENLANGRSGSHDTAAGQKGMAEQFLNLVTKAAGDEEAAFGQLSRAEQVRNVAEQILEKVRVVVGDAQSSIEISLTPESLGKVTLNLVSKQGALTAHFTAENQIAKEAIESQIVVLRENLENQGLKVEAIEVAVSNFDFMQNGGGTADQSAQENRQRRGRGVTFEEAVQAESMTEAEAIAADMMERSGNQVDYTA